ncbi:hypothetical protein JR316_0006703 [Psilocybe cubensis]|uniref:Uncharacterized protein n=1 Tax=Psilocybe cubensis TaxID=181762 RepID=A0ACB8GX10_PSICU|nr:hypothetical protein JR316_0006703 [Psilocybe cubensis]KAH9480106.1 hypothetical protein JR316_0006703 [Psilocybe cubensis]
MSQLAKNRCTCFSLAAMEKQLSVLNSDCTCHVAGTTCLRPGHFLPPEVERWYSVVVGRRPGPVQGRAAALDNYTGISGGHALFCPSELIAKAHFYSALERGEVVEVVPPVRTVLNREDVSTCTGFRPEDPSTPEVGTWTLVIVGREPGIFSLTYRPQGSIVHLNIQGIRGSQTKALPTRTDAVNKFLQLVDAGEVVRVSGDSNLRIAHTPETYLKLCRYCQNM